MRRAPKLPPRATSRRLGYTPRQYASQWRGQLKLADEAAALLGNPRTPDEVRRLLQSAMRRWSKATGIDAASPELARLAFVVMNFLSPCPSDCETEEDAHRARARLDVLDVLHLVKLGRKLDPDVLARLSEDAPARPLELPDETPDELPPVVDLNCWRQARPRPVTRLLFAEKGGE